MSPESLAAVLPSAAATLGAEEFVNTLELPQARSVCVVLVDGLGYAALQQKRGHAPFLSNIWNDADIRLGSTFPSTTVAALSSLGTGVLPGEHGMVGYEVLDPEQDLVLNLLSGWDAVVKPKTWQPVPTVFERLAGIIPTTTVSLPKYGSSALTQASLRGSAFRGATTPQARVRAVAETIRKSPGSLVYLYWGELDRAGHRFGVDSVRWEHELEELDANLRRLAAELPRETLLLVTADHGMVDIAPEHRIDYSKYPELLQGVRHAAGEPRLVQLYLEERQPEAKAEAAARLQEAWRKAWGEAVVAMTRKEAIEAGYYGPVRSGVAARIGDVLIAVQEPLAFFHVAQKGQMILEMVGQHGSTTAAEREVPLLQVLL